MEYGVPYGTFHMRHPYKKEKEEKERRERKKERKKTNYI